MLLTRDANYQALNQNPNLITGIKTGIETTLLITVTNDDFEVTNNHQNDVDNQKPDTVVSFTVTAVEESQLITDKFTFTITLLPKEI